MTTLFPRVRLLRSNIEKIQNYLRVLKYTSVYIPVFSHKYFEVKGFH